MYCKNCGNEMEQGAAVCVKCGFKAGLGGAYCQHCGAAAPAGADVCMNCGFAVKKTPVGCEQKSKLIAGLLGILLGSLGVHNFYLGFTGKGLAQILITFCTCGIGSVITSIWGLIEGVLILTGGISEDADGVPLKD